MKYRIHPWADGVPYWDVISEAMRRGDGKKPVAKDPGDWS